MEILIRMVEKLDFGQVDIFEVMINRRLVTNKFNIDNVNEGETLLTLVHEQPEYFLQNKN